MQNKSYPVANGVPQFEVGLNGQGFWVAQEVGGRRGGLFADRDAAVRFAMSQNGKVRENVVVVAKPVELRFSSKAKPASNRGGAPIPSIETRGFASRQAVGR